MSIWHALHVHVLCISFYHEIMPTSYTQIFRNSKEPYNIKSQNKIAAMMQLTALWRMHFLKLNLNTIITYLNVPSRLEACLFFLLGEKKLASLWQQCQQQPDFCCAGASSSTTTTLLRFVLSFWFRLLSCPAFSIIPVKKNSLYMYNKYATSCNKSYLIYRIWKYSIYACK